MTSPAILRSDAEKAAAPFPNLLVEAERLSASVMHGAHGRKKAGMGETFWQYRPAMQGDAHTSIDWRRSARSDTLFIREMEWEAAQTVYLWCDASPEMDFKSELAQRSKRERANLLCLALSIVLCRTGERVALMESAAVKPLSGETQIHRIATALLNNEYQDKSGKNFLRHSRAVLFSDYLDSIENIETTLQIAAENHVSGTLFQINDPAEEAFPYKGRTLFENISGGIKFETDRADSLKTAYQEKLQERRNILKQLAAQYGWQFTTHRTNQSAQSALLWLNQQLEGSRR